MASWASVHVSYHDTGNQDNLLLDAVRPLFTRLEGQRRREVREPDVLGSPGAHGVRAYFLRHWMRGPHLRLNIFAPPDTFAALVRPAVDEVVGGYLRTHPSTVDLDPAALLPMHQRLAEYETEPGTLLPWYPDNTVQDADYDSRLSILGSQEAADLLAGFHLDTTEWAFRVLDRVRRGEASLLAVAFDLMAATAHAMARNGITGGFVSFRSHGEAFLCAWPEGPALRPGWDDSYAARAGVLIARVRAVVAALDRGAMDRGAMDRGGGEQAGEPAATIRDWLDVLTATTARAEGLLAAGLDLGLRPPAGRPRQVIMSERAAHLIALSPFHRALESNPSWPRRRESLPFLRYRFAVNCLYLAMTRLGVTPVERFRLCHWVANAVEDAYGVSAIELVSGGSGSGDGGSGTLAAAGTPAAGAAGGAR
jgi:hypothetical protein